ncbi:hypothetical protein M422DRAFT_265734 [Sphaerobolus stellatus SS14]|uniref:F-box domain-containing protein n=1 Tax=Sphaerobolus stellatus (strain SS14) TaxID=990650 RepID=A0A0C9V4P7_SPHS4|nr:hypothetical protein M422DRAFT_265732 [Sphaerobolus stellatus SS14]KIJ32406.1 hypothetical protein M422DRAFT_265734 [Sphaerobolus stellatus SS14]
MSFHFLNDLPNEILRQIILHVIPFESYQEILSPYRLSRELDNLPFAFDSELEKEDPLPVVLRLSSVCTLWRDTIDDMSRAWSTLAFKTTTVIDIHPPIERAHGKWTTSIPIDLHFECTESSAQLEPAAKLLIPFRSQIKNLSQVCDHVTNCLLPHLFSGDEPISLTSLQFLEIYNVWAVIFPQRTTKKNTSMLQIWINYVYGSLALISNGLSRSDLYPRFSVFGYSIEMWTLSLS